MALVVLLRGVNVGGHRTFRPAVLSEQLKHLDIINIGAAGTFVVKQPVSPARIRSELKHRLPFDTHIVVSQGRHFVRMLSQNPFKTHPVRPDIVRFVSVLSRQPGLEPALPMAMPSHGKWFLRILERRGQFVFGVYRRHMKAISYLSRLDRLFGVPLTTRNWNTITAIAQVLGASATASGARHEKKTDRTPRKTRRA